MIFEGMEISQQEWDEFVNEWNLDKLKQDEDTALPAIIRGIKWRILEARLDAMADRKVACLQKWYGLLMSGLSDDVKPDLTKPLPTKEEVNDFKARIINFFKNELYDGKTVKPHWLEQGIDQLIPWERLKETAWLSFYKEYSKI